MNIELLHKTLTELRATEADILRMDNEKMRLEIVMYEVLAKMKWSDRTVLPAMPKPAPKPAPIRIVLPETDTIARLTDAARYHTAGQMVDAVRSDYNGDTFTTKALREACMKRFPEAEMKLRQGLWLAVERRVKRGQIVKQEGGIYRNTDNHQQKEVAA